MDILSVSSGERAWQEELTERLVRAREALGKVSVDARIISNHLIGRAAEQMSEWLHDESERGAQGRSLSFRLGEGAVRVLLREVTEEDDFDRGRFRPQTLEPTHESTEFVVDKVALVSVAPTEKQAASMVYYAHDVQTGEWVQLSTLAQTLKDDVQFVPSEAHQQTIEEATGAHVFMPEFTGELKPVG